MGKNDVLKERARTIAAIAVLAFGLISPAAGSTFWQSQGALHTADAAAYDYFGYSADCDTDLAVFGAPHDDDNGDKSGSAYVFVGGEAGWSEQAKLTGSDGRAGDCFGFSVAVSSETIVVGAPYHDANGIDSGAVYVFGYDGQTWVEQIKLIPADASAGAQFGEAISLRGDHLIVGARYDSQAGQAAGAAYVFERTGPGWQQSAKLTASDAAAYDEFGWSVAIRDGCAIVGSIADDDAAADCGSAYVFALVDANWVEQAKLVPGRAYGGDGFGMSVAISNGWAVVGCAFGSWDGIENPGAVYVYERGESGWVEHSRIAAADGRSNDGFGTSVAVDADAVVIGAEFDDLRVAQSGSAYVYEFDGRDWRLKKGLSADESDLYDRFGGAVSITGPCVFVCAAYDDDLGMNSGSVYVFRLRTLYADMNDDVCVDSRDFALLASEWGHVTYGSQESYCRADADRNGQVDAEDLRVLAEEWLVCGQ